MKVIVTQISISGFEMKVCGTASEEFPDNPFTGTVSFDDFEDKEDWRSVIRILTKVASTKLVKNETEPVTAIRVTATT